MHKVIEKLKEELFEILPPTIFFLVALHVLAIIRVLMSEGSHFEPMSTVSIAVGSLILGKSVLIADTLPAFRGRMTVSLDLDDFSMKRIDIALTNMLASAAKPK